MPYVKFDSDSEYTKFHNLLEKEKLEDIILIALLNDPNYGNILFISQRYYSKYLENCFIKYEIIPNEKITSPYVDYLRKLYPEMADEL